MSKASSAIVIRVKKKLYRLYCNYSIILRLRDLFFVICTGIRTIFYILQDFFAYNIETVNVKVEQGVLRGRRATSVFGKKYYSFRGVPYAKPPIGPLRFKDPEPPESWTGVRDALRHGNIGAQFDWVTGFFVGNEDSLFLNVYTPKIPEDAATFKKKAVLFWVHGGAFFFGFSNDFLYGPSLFINEDVVLVTINYRLGPLGFLTTGTKDAPGNAGFKDLILALKWVNKNIANFGGDPENVTVFGESAGGCMVNCLMLTPLAKGLFHKAIAQSGTAMSWWAFNDSLVECSFQLGKNLGIHTDDPKVLADSLRKIPTRQIARKQRHYLSEKRRRHCVPFDYTLCAEPEDHPNAALTQDPRDLCLKGKYVSDVPFLTGINEKEGIASLHTILLFYPDIIDIDNDFERIIPNDLKLKPGSEESKKVAEEIRKFYLNGKPLNKSTYKGFINLITDTNFWDALRLSTRSHLKYLKSPVYNYKFEADGRFNLYKKVLPFTDIKGATHSDEMFYLFSAPGLGKNLTSNSREATTARRMVRLWSNFAKYGNPTPDPNDELLQKVVWPRVTKGGNEHLNIGDDLTVSHDAFWNDRMRFWDNMKAKYSSDAQEVM